VPAAWYYFSQLDYICFVDGLVFLLLAFACIRADWQWGEKLGLPWRWLVLYGLLQAAASWLKMSALSLSEAGDFEMLHTGLTLISFVALAEFGRRSWSGLGARKLMTLAFTSLLLATGGVSAAGWIELEASARYFLGVPGSALSGLVLWRVSRSLPGAHGIALKVAAVGMAGAGLAFGIAANERVSDLTAWPSFAIRPAIAGLPAELFRGLGTFLGGIGIWHCGSTGFFSKDGRAWHIRLALPFFLLVLISLSWYATDLRGRALDGRMREDILRQARGIAAAIPQEEVKALTFTLDDLDRPQFKRICNQMIAYGHLLENVRGIYSLAVRRGEMVFGPENYDPEDPMASPPGTVYREPSPEDWEAFRTGLPYTIGPFWDEYGAFVAALAPVLDPCSGEVLMLVGIDVTADRWQAMVGEVRHQMILAGMALACFFLGGLGLLQWRRFHPDRAMRVWLRHGETILAGVLGTGIALILGAAVHELELNRLRDEFVVKAELRAHWVTDVFRGIQRDLAKMKRFFEVSQYVDAQEFSAYVGPLVTASNVQAWQWIPIVPATGILAFETHMRLGGNPDFQVREKNATGAVVPAGKRETYYPLAYIASSADHASLLGFDFGSEPERMAAIEEALETGLPVATPAVEPLQLMGDELCIEAFERVQKPGYQRPSGLVACLLRPQGTISTVFEPGEKSRLHVDFDLVEIRSGESRTTMVYPSEWAFGTPAVTTSDLSALNGLFHPLFLFGRTWAVVTRPTEAFLSGKRTWAGAAAFGSGLLLTAAVTMLIGFFRSRETTLERQVAERTSALHESRERLSLATRGTGLGVWDYRVREDRLEWDENMFALFGTDRENFGGCLADWMNLLPPELRSEAVATFDSALAGGRDFYLEFPVRKSSGEMCHLVCTATVVPDASGRPSRVVGIHYDITERRRAEDALRESEETFRLVFENAPLGLFHYDIAGVITDCNDVFVDIIGSSREALTGLDMARLPDTRITAALGEALEGRLAIFEGDYRSYTADKVTSVRVFFAPIRDQAGKVKGGVGIVEDVSPRKKAEDALRESESRFRYMAEILPFPVSLISPTGRYEYVNPMFIEVFGYTLEDVPTGKDWLIRAYPDEGQRKRALEVWLQDIRQMGEYQVRPRTFNVFCKDGSSKKILFRPMTIKGGMQFIVYEDITERERAEAALRESEERYRTLFENSLDAIVVMEPPDWSCSSANRAALDMFRIEGLQQLVSRPLWELSPLTQPDGRESSAAAEEIVKQVLEEGGRLFEWTHQRDDGDLFPSTVLLTRMEQDGEVFLQATVRDISDYVRGEEERRLLEAQIQQTQKLESLGVLAGGIAHDFNNILMAVMGYAELALEMVSPQSAARSSLREIITAARRAAELCRQMLAYSGQASFSLEPTDLKELVEEMAHLLKTSISKKAILNLNIERGLPLVMADSSQIRQIVMNLIINASDAIGDRSGVIHVAVGASRCDERYLKRTELHETLMPGLYVHIEVSDTGCGMDAQTRSRIFEPFFSTKFTGRGLGLAAVLGIVRAHKGAIKVYSESNKGSRFRVLLPSMNGSEAGDASSAVEHGRMGWMGEGTILLVDDEESLRALGARMFERLGYSVLTAADGREALDIYRERGTEIDFVFLDLTMPHMDGAEAFGELRRLNPDVRVMIASGYSEEDVAARFAGKGLAGVLQKPFTLERLEEILRGLALSKDV